ncbi:MAG: hypothetical protein JWR37_5394 [Mycobacterium sp.]|nr:hypothetical protein [Mycobacterium sp.]
MQLVRNGIALRGTVAVLAENQVRVTAAGVVALERVRPVQQDHHVRVLPRPILTQAAGITGSVTDDGCAASCRIV